MTTKMSVNFTELHQKLFFIIPPCRYRLFHAGHVLNADEKFLSIIPVIITLFTVN
jgi:hypothetical protein